MYGSRTDTQPQHPSQNGLEAESWIKKLVEYPETLSKLLIRLWADGKEVEGFVIFNKMSSAYKLILS